MSQVKAGAAYVELLLRRKAFEQGLKAARQQLDAFSANMRAMGTRLAAASAVMAAPIGVAVAAYSRFDDAMKQVRSVSQASASDYVKLQEKVLELGRTTSFTASQIANLMTELARAGFNPSEVMNMTEAVMNLARATGTDATRSAGIMAATIRQYGLEATDATRVSDVLTAAANKSFNTVESLGEAMKYAAPVAKAFGMSVEETAAVLGALGNMGIQGSDAGTSLRRLLTLSSAAAGKFKSEFGVMTTDAAGSVRPLIDILGDVSDATKDMASGERGEKMAKVFGLLGITSATAIGASVTNARELHEEIQKAGGVAGKTAKEMESGIGGAFRLVLSAAEGLQLAIGGALDAPIQRVSRALADAMAGVVGWIDKNHEAIQSIAKGILVVGGIGAAMLAAGGAAATLSLAIGAITGIATAAAGAFALLKGLLIAMVSPIGLIVVGVAGMGAYLLQSSGIGAQAIAGLSARFGELKSGALATIGAIGRALASGDLGQAANVAWLAIKAAWLTGTQSLRDTWEGFKVAYMKVTSDMVYGGAKAMSEGWAGTERAWVETIDFFADSWAIFTGLLTETWHNTVGFIKKAWVRLKSMFDSDIDVNAEVNRINEETAEKTGAARQSMLESIGDRDTKRRGTVDRINSEREQRAKALAEMQASDERLREQQGQQAIANNAAELAAARKAWQDAVAVPPDDATAPTVDSDTDTKAAVQKQIELAFNQTMKTAMGGMKGESSGTFSAAAIRGMGASSLADRTLKAMEAVADNTAKLVDLTDDGALTFT